MNQRPLLTLFTIPKGFSDHTEVIQRNALASWKQLEPSVEIIVCGDDPGTGEVVRDFDVDWIPDIAQNEFGTPILRSAFERVAERSCADLLCYVNADIILFPDIVSALQDVDLRRSVVAGRRWDLDVDSPIDFEDPAYEPALRSALRERGQRHGGWGSDYFIFRADDRLIHVPPFGVGRPGWDCWFIYNVRKLGYRMIDASPAITLLHQNHDYSHLSARSGATCNGKIWTGPEIRANHRLIGDYARYFNLGDATHILTSSGVYHAWDYAHIRSRWYRLPELHPSLRSMTRLLEKATPEFAKQVLHRMLG